MNLRKMEKFITHMTAYLKCLLTFCFYRNWLGRNCLLYLDIETESAFSTKPKPVSTNGSRPFNILFAYIATTGSIETDRQ